MRPQFGLKEMWRTGRVRRLLHSLYRINVVVKEHKPPGKEFRSSIARVIKYRW